MKKSLFAVEDS